MTAPDYANLIDEETWAFIKETENRYPPDAIHRTIQEQRDVYDRMCRAFFTGYPAGVTAVDTAANGVPVRSYTKAGNSPAAVVVYFHGGGFVVGGLESHDDICAEICDRTGLYVVSADYRMAPEHVHPASYNDCIGAFTWTQKEYDLPIILVGDSAGGNLAAAVAHTTRHHPNAAIGQVLIYPGLGGDPESGSYLYHANAPLLTLADINFYKDIRTGGKDLSGDATYAPLWDTDFSKLPPTFVFAAECDPLFDDAPEYCEALRKSSVRATMAPEKGLVHGYLRARHTVDRARKSFTKIIAAINSFVKPSD